MKKAQSVRINLLVVGAVFILLLLVILSVVFLGRYNSEKHVCLEYGEYEPDQCDWIELIDEDDKYLCWINISPMKYSGTKYKGHKCSRWKSKTYCDLNPTDHEKCVCDNWKSHPVHAILAKGTSEPVAYYCPDGHVFDWINNACLICTKTHQKVR